MKQDNEGQELVVGDRVLIDIGWSNHTHIVIGEIVSETPQRIKVRYCLGFKSKYSHMMNMMSRNCLKLTQDLFTMPLPPLRQPGDPY